MNSSAMQALRERVRLAKLKTAVAEVAGGVLPEELAARANHEINQLTKAIEEVSEKVNDDFNSPAQVMVRYNKEQLQFIEYVSTGQPVALTGPAGSGKTTVVRGAVQKLLEMGKLLPFGPSAAGHRWLDVGAPGIVFTAFTNKAVENIKRFLPKELRGNCITLHKLLEYQPEYFEVMQEDGSVKKTMQFLPKYHEGNPLPSGIQTLVIEEATMTSVDLWNVLAAAVHHKLQVILIGDIQQLPPVFGKSIFIHAMNYGVNKVELVEVHRQALESPIIALAHKILAGQQIHAPKLPDLNVSNEHGSLTVRPWKKDFSDMAALVVMDKLLGAMIREGDYDPYEDAILTPFNVNFGTDALNRIVADHLVTLQREKDPEAKESKVYEIIAGIKTKYLRVGDKVLHNKTEHTVVDISRNSKYFGKPPRFPSSTMNYSGVDTGAGSSFFDVGEEGSEDVDDLLNSLSFMNGDSEKEERKRAASHIVSLHSSSLDQVITLSASGEIANLDHGYAITVHKSQGSEYERVLFITHKSQSTMFYRELIYTAVTRAKKHLVILCPPNLFVQGINTQRIPGKTLEEKLEAFDRDMKLKKGASEVPEKMYMFKPNYMAA